MADAQEFDGSTYIDIGSDLPILNGATAATLSAWINPDAVNGLVGTQQLVSFSIVACAPQGEGQHRREGADRDERAAVGKSPGHRTTDTA